ncbi:MAG: amidohydrolase family protein [Clostridia bacterium]|nr:amidohydrolase family protein [Clostridia bacterium]
MNKILKIDIHAHARPVEAVPTDSMLEYTRVLEIYDKLGVERGGILPFIRENKPNGVLSWQNAKMLTEQNPDRFFWYTTVDLEKDTHDGKPLFEFLAEQKALGAKGVGEVTTKLYFDDPRVGALFDAAAALELPVLFHTAPDFSARYGVVDDLGLPRLERMLAAYPTVKYIGHAKAFWSEISELGDENAREKTSKEPVVEGRLPHLMRKYKNLYCDLSAASGSNAMMRDRAYAARFLTEFSDRVLYGCDICNEKSTYQYEFAEFLDGLAADGSISEATYRKVLRENAMTLFQL